MTEKCFALPSLRRTRSGPCSVLLREVSGFVWSSFHAGYFRRRPASKASSLCQHHAQFHRDVEVSSRWEKERPFCHWGRGKCEVKWYKCSLYIGHRTAPITCLIFRHYWQSEQQVSSAPGAFSRSFRRSEVISDISTGCNLQIWRPHLCFCERSPR